MTKPAVRARGWTLVAASAAVAFCALRIASGGACVDASAWPRCAATPPSRTGPGIVGDVASTAPVRRAVAMAPAYPVAVVDDDDGAAVCGANVRVAFAGTGDSAVTWRAATTGAGGVAVFAADAAPIAVLVIAAGRAPTAQVWPDGAIDATIRARRAAELRLRFVDRAGRPVAGVGARLVPPLMSGPRLAADWRDALAADQWPTPLVSAHAGELRAAIAEGLALGQSRRIAAAADGLRELSTRAMASDSDGTVRFAGLFAADGWRWGLETPHGAEIVPPHETVAMVGAHGALATRATNPVDTLSGAVQLEPGAVRELVVVVRQPAGLCGSFVAAGATLPPQVKLYRVTRTDGPGGRGVVEIKPEAFTVATSDGSFCFDEVRPGTKIVRAYWRTGEHGYWFASRAVHVPEGQRTDVGAIAALPDSVVVRVELQDRRGAALAAEQVFGHAGARAIVHLEAWRELGALADSQCELVPVPLAQDVLLHGLPPGQLRLRGLRGVDWPPSIGGSRRLVDSQQVECSVPSSAPIRLPLSVEARVERALTIVNAGGFGVAHDLWLRPLAGGAPQRIAIRSDPAATAAQLRFAVLPERYEVLVVSRGDPAQAMTGAAEFDFAVAASASMTLAHGATVAGVCRRADGRPLVSARLYWTRDGFRSDGADVWLFQARTDDEGRFVVGGLPPGAALRGARPGTDLVAPEADACAVVELMLTR